MYTVWNASKCGVFSGPYFPAFGLNTERYEVSLRIQSGCMKIRNIKNSVFGHFSRSDKLQKRFKTKNENIAKFKMRKSNFDNRNRSTNWNSTVGFTKSHFHNATKSIRTYRKSWYQNNWFWYDKKAKYHYRTFLYPLLLTNQRKNQEEQIQPNSIYHIHQFKIGQCNCIEFRSFIGKHFRISNARKKIIKEIF